MRTGSVKNGERLKSLRKSKKMIQSEFAKVIGVHQTQVSRYERNKDGIPKDTLILLNKLFDIELKVWEGNNGI
jgi:transcriptional regulator with XRE-family HTH domain